jgi:hypothetical protein
MLSIYVTQYERSRTRITIDSGLSNSFALTSLVHMLATFTLVALCLLTHFTFASVFKPSWFLPGPQSRVSK